MQNYKKHLHINLIILIVLLQTQTNSYAQSPKFLNPISLYYGTSFRFDNTYRHLITIDYWHHNTTCITSNYKGYSITSEIANKNNFNLGLRFYSTLHKDQRIIFDYPLFFYAISPTIYSINQHQGLTIAPEIGIHSRYEFNSNMGLSLFIYYGYDIPVINKNDYILNRNRLTIKLGFDNYRRNKKHKSKQKKSLK